MARSRGQLAGKNKSSGNGNNAIMLKERTAAHETFYFSPASTLWKVNREQVLLLGGARALLLQVAHPLVAEAVYDHSYVFQRPIKRLLRTLDLTLKMVFGTRQEVLEAARTVNQTHHPVTGALSEAVGIYPKGTPYDAHDPELKLWVYATLVEGAVSTYERLIGPLTDAEKQAFFADSCVFAALLGVKQGILPASYDDLCMYMEEMIASGRVIVSRKAREIAPYIMAETYPILKPLTLPPSRITVGLLPPALRAQYGYTFSRWEQKALDTFCTWMRRTVPFLPAQVRYVWPYLRTRGIASLGSK
jgi:uncharacterized protein (DUF2236 family)